MRTLQGACLATSPATEPSTRAAPWIRLLPTAIIDASSRIASLHSALAVALSSTPTMISFNRCSFGRDPARLAESSVTDHRRMPSLNGHRVEGVR
jgi:hypothetical protein